MSHEEFAELEANDPRRPCRGCDTGYIYPDEHHCVDCGWSSLDDEEITADIPVQTMGEMVRS